MNIYIKKISFLLLSVAFIFVGCENEETLVLTSPEPALTLQQPGISTVFLNFGTPDNPAITLSWNDDVTSSTSYDIEMGLDSEFKTPTKVGSSDSNSFTMSVQELNDAVRSAGAMTYIDIATYFRVNASGTISNGVQYLVTTYPIELPVITSPSNNDAFVLSLDMADEVALTANWTDPVLDSNLGDTVNYTVEGAAIGTDFAAPVTLGTAENNTTVTSTHADLNAAAIGIGLIADTAGDMEIRVVARNINANGNELERASEIVTVKITPYNVAFPNLFLVGDATTPGWNNNNNNTVVFRNQDIPNAYVYTGYFGAGAFKLLETKGEWHPQWGTNDNTTLGVSTPEGNNEPGTFNVATAGYYTYNFTTVGEGGSFTVEAYDASGAAEYPTIGIIGDATPNGWDSDTDFTQDPNNPHLWYITGVTLTNGGSMLIRANDVWPPDANAAIWRYTGSSELYGTARLDNDGGDNIPFNEPTGTYDFWFNDLDGSYNIVPR